MLSPTLYYSSGRQSRRASNLEIVCVARCWSESCEVRQTETFGPTGSLVSRKYNFRKVGSSPDCAKITELFIMSLALVAVYQICATPNSVGGLPS